MAVEVVELAASRSHGVGYTDGTGRRTYVVRDNDAAADNISAVVLAVAAVAPFYWNNMSRQEFECDHQGGNVYLVTVPYKYTAQTGGGDGGGSGTLVGVAPDPTQPPTPGGGPGGGDPSNPPSGPASENDRLTANVSIEIGGKPPRLYTSLHTIESAGYGGATPKDFKGLIQVDPDGKLEGVEVPEPEVVLSQDFTFDWVTWKFVGVLKDLVWCCNDRPWYTFPKFDVAFLGATLKPDNQGRVVASMRFGLSKNRPVLKGEIRPGLKRIALGDPGLPHWRIDVPGWHYLWVTYTPEDDATLGLRVERADACYVEQLLPEKDFRFLGIGG